MIHLVVMRLFGLVAINKIPDEPFSHLAHSWDDVMGVVKYRYVNSCWSRIKWLEIQ